MKLMVLKEYSGNDGRPVVINPAYFITAARHPRLDDAVTVQFYGGHYTVMGTVADVVREYRDAIDAST